MVQLKLEDLRVNRRNQTEELAWDDALVGFASGVDQIWQQYKEYVGPFHWTP